MDRIEKLKEFLKISEKDSFLQHALALEYIKTGDNEEALKLFNEILKREPAYIGSYYHLGKVHEKMGDNAEALRVYERGMEVAKEINDRHSYNELRSAYEELETT
jgi:Tfp pilus assembly protein PilF